MINVKSLRKQKADKIFIIMIIIEMLFLLVLLYITNIHYKVDNTNDISEQEMLEPIDSTMLFNNTSDFTFYHNTIKEDKL